ncbi:MAG: L-lysine 2,3-aminomutase, partial [Chlamydiae bacterium]|nr:L-lysine 2,3-aminomutase [Chlamydiota bacterium]
MKWRAIQKDNFRSWEALADFLQIEKSRILKRPTFPLNMPRRLAEKVEKGVMSDPILRQFLPTVDEESPAAGFCDDPLSDRSFQKTPRLLKKYEGRALLMPTSACAMNCRFCFRQNYPYEVTDTLQNELAAIRDDPTLFEIILSGGDPLSLSDEKLGALIEALDQIPHLKLLRIHTRFPIGIPERITEGFVKILKRSRLQTIFVLHTN